jgi:hypothetical protein
MVHTDYPVMFYTQVFALHEHLGRHVLHTGGELGSHEERQFARVLDFTYTLRVVFYNRGDQSGFLRVRKPEPCPSGFSHSVTSSTGLSHPF